MSMEFDLHTHSSQGSACSRMNVWDLVQAAQEAEVILGKKGTGGSDAHSTLSVGSCVTVFDNPVKNYAQLLAQLRNGSFHAKKKEEYRNVLGM